MANTKDLLQGQNSVVIPHYNAYFWNFLIAFLDAIDRVQPRSSTTCVGWWARSKETDAIQAENLVLYYALVEESSEQLEYLTHCSKRCPSHSSTEFSVAENPVCGEHLLCFFFFLVFAFAFVSIKNQCLSRLQVGWCEIHLSETLHCLFEKPKLFLPRFLLGSPNTIFFWPQFWFIRCSLPTNALLLFFPFAFTSFLPLSAREWSRLPSILVVVASWTYPSSPITSSAAHSPT